MPDRLRVYCDSLGRFVSLPAKPQRIVSLVSGLTEALFEIGCGEAVVGISAYCPRYVPNLSIPVVGDYLTADEDLLRQLSPDLVLTTTGVQRGLGKKLSEKGFPVYPLPLPDSLHGILENVLTLGALTDEMTAARILTQRWSRLFLDLTAASPTPRPTIYAECWYGKHVRMTGGLTFINDLLEAAGGENIFGEARAGYLPLDVREVERRHPDILILYSEPEYPVQAQALLAERNWKSILPQLRVIEVDTQRGRNLIHDGPSMMETANWLHKMLLEAK